MTKKVVKQRRKNVRSEIVNTESSEVYVETYNGFEAFLLSVGLPSENVIASFDERENVMAMLPSLLNQIPIEQKRDAYYLSRFVAGAAIGLFDASLNYVWNEVVLNLRRKIVYYGLDTFYDQACNNKNRDQYTSENDLSGLKDRVMLDTLKKLEWISDIVYRKLCHILDMRNQIGASHPNSYDINSYELLGWLKTCVTEVINDVPSASAIQVHQIIDNIKRRTEPLDSTTLQSFQHAIADLSSGMASNLLVAMFGIYLSEDTSNEVRQNVISVSKVIWPYAKSETKYSLGEKKEYYKNNLDAVKENLAYGFIEACDGLSFLTISDRSIMISNLCDNLLITHYSWDNYYNEPPIIKDIMKYISKSSDIPKDQEAKLISIITECRIGKEVAYCEGVSPKGKEYYDAFFKILSKEQVILFLEIFKRYMDSIYEGNSIRANNAKEILLLIKSPVHGERINEIIDFMLYFADNKNLTKVYKDTRFRELCNGVISLT
ncbi:MAG: hypothetical protein IKT67_09265 [Lachnospiraceae bacterium]|nr:hypothetical protein [Lachnospiraceae bacterium]